MAKKAAKKAVRKAVKKVAVAAPGPKRKAGRPKGAKTVYDPERHCGAKTSSKTNDGSPCTHLKGHETDHPGVGRCKYHGGRNPMKHGRYSTLTRSAHTARYHEIREQLEEEGNPLDLIPDLTHLRAKSMVLHEEEERDRQALIDWHESYTGKFRAELRAIQEMMKAGNPEELAKALNRLREIMDEMPPKPTKVWDPFAFTKAVNAMATLVSKITEQRERQQVPIKAVIDLQDKMAIVMMTEMRRHFSRVPEKGNKLAEKIAEQWRDINIEF